MHALSTHCHTRADEHLSSCRWRSRRPQQLPSIQPAFLWRAIIVGLFEHAPQPFMPTSFLWQMSGVRSTVLVKPTKIRPNWADLPKFHSKHLIFFSISGFYTLQNPCDISCRLCHPLLRIFKCSLVGYHPMHLKFESLEATRSTTSHLLLTIFARCFLSATHRNSATTEQHRSKQANKKQWCNYERPSPASC